MKDLRVIFMGSPLFSVPTLEELNKYTNIVAVVSQPDKPVGRKRILTACPVKQKAQELGLNIYTPDKLNKEYDYIKELNPDIIITCAYGQIISEDILNIPKLGCFNLHGSLLPKYRGGAPIHYALLNGDKETGITLMYMDKGMDSGDMIKSKSIPIDDNDNIETLTNKLSIIASKLIIEELPNLVNKTNDRVKQDESKVVYSPIIKRCDEHLNFYKSSKDVYNLFRALCPSPYPNFILDDIEYKIIECNEVDKHGKPSTIIEVNKDSIVIACLDNAINITKIKPNGKNIMLVKDFLNGYHRELLNKEVK